MFQFVGGEVISFFEVKHFGCKGLTVFVKGQAHLKLVE